MDGLLYTVFTLYILSQGEIPWRGVLITVGKGPVVMSNDETGYCASESDCRKLPSTRILQFVNVMLNLFYI